MRTKLDSYKERAVKLSPFFEDYLIYAAKIKDEMTKILGDVEVYVFGSRLTKKYSPYHSDIDILVISANVPESASDRAQIKRKVFDNLRFSEPFEVHLVTPEEYEAWYRYLIKEKQAV